MRYSLSWEKAELKFELYQQIIKNEEITRMYKELNIKVRHDSAQVAMCM